jgi:hypothetical protein
MVTQPTAENITDFLGFLVEMVEETLDQKKPALVDAIVQGVLIGVEIKTTHPGLAEALHLACTGGDSAADVARYDGIRAMVTAWETRDKGTAAGS